MIMEIVGSSIAIIATIILLGRMWVLPESARQNCIEAVHTWHIERIHKVEGLELDIKIKNEMIKSSFIQESKDLEKVCGVKQ